jgi:hypothetical protein
VECNFPKTTALHREKDLLSSPLSLNDSWGEKNEFEA